MKNNVAVKLAVRRLHRLRHWMVHTTVRVLAFIYFLRPLPLTTTTAATSITACACNPVTVNGVTLIFISRTRIHPIWLHRRHFMPPVFMFAIHDEYIQFDRLIACEYVIGRCLAWWPCRLVNETFITQFPMRHQQRRIKERHKTRYKHKCYKERT